MKAWVDNQYPQRTRVCVRVFRVQAAIRSGGMFRLAKIDAEKQRSVAEILGIAAFPSIFGMKDGILLDNFVGILPQDEVCMYLNNEKAGRSRICNATAS